jgi:hypothetical protein
MKSNLITRALALMLAIFTVAVMLVACAQTGKGDETSGSPDRTTTPEGTDSETVAESKEEDDKPEVIDTNGYDYFIYCKDNKLWFEMYACEAGTATGDIISDALYARETYIENLYNCNITMIKDSKIADKLEINHDVGGPDAEHLADIVFTSGKDTLNLALKGIFENVLKLENLRIGNSYWDQNIQKEYLLSESLFCLEGDINVRDDLRTMQVTYNKKLYEDYNLDDTYGSIYDLVRNYKWTFETMMTMCRDLYQDVDGDGYQGMKDIYGILSEGTAPYYFFLGSGKKPVTNDNGKIVINLADEAILEYVDKTLELGYNSSSCVVNNGQIVGMSSTWDDAITLFKGNQALFRSSALSSVNGYVDMDADYGLLPIPMINENQGRYYCWTASGNHYPLSIPVDGIKDYNTSTLITEALAFYSKYAKTDNYNEAFYEMLADYRLGQTADDTDMLDIIFASKTYELDQPLVITKVENRMYTLTKQKYTGSMKPEIDAMFTSSKMRADEITVLVKNLEKRANATQ